MLPILLHQHVEVRQVQSNRRNERLVIELLYQCRRQETLNQSARVVVGLLYVDNGVADDIGQRVRRIVVREVLLLLVQHGWNRDVYIPSVMIRPPRRWNCLTNSNVVMCSLIPFTIVVEVGICVDVPKSNVRQSACGGLRRIGCSMPSL